MTRDDQVATTATQKRNLYELLGHPVAGDSSDLGTVYTASPETHDEGGGLDLLV